MRLPVVRLLLSVCALLAVVPAAANAATTPPKVTSVAPLKLKIGDRLTIRGKGFLAGKNRNTVLFKATGSRAVFVKAETATATKIVVKVPAKLLSILKVRSGQSVATKFQLRVLARRLSRAYTPAKGSPTIAPAVTTGPAPAGSAVAATTPTSTAASTTPAAAAAPSAPTVVAASDCDADGISDTTDPDDDNDLLSDTTELAIGTSTCNADTDGDGMQDGWEYQSAVDLNTRSCPQVTGKYPVPCAAAMPSPTKHRSYPNPLEGDDGGKDPDGDWMTNDEEYAAWARKAAADSTYRALLGPKGMWYSAGKQASVDTAGLTSCNGMAVPDPFNGNMVRPEFRRADGTYPNLYEADGTTVKPAYEVYSLDRRSIDGCLDDGERDEDGDFLTNFEEAHNVLSGPGFWATATAEPAFITAFAGTDWLDADSDGDGSVDGLDDQDFDDFLNVEEINRGTPVRDKNNKYTGSEAGLWVDPFNPCLPYVKSRTCPTALPVGDPGAWRPFFTDMSSPAGPRWPLYRDWLYQITEKDPTWVDPTPNDPSDDALGLITRPRELWSAPAGVVQSRVPEHPLQRTNW